MAAIKTLTSYTKLRNAVKKYVIKQLDLGIDPEDFGFDISAYKTGNQILKEALDPKAAWRDVQKRTKDLQKAYTELKADIKHMKKSAGGKYDRYYEEFENLSTLLSANITFIGRYADDASGIAEKTAKTINLVASYENKLRNKLQRIASRLGKQRKLSGYTQGESGRIICGYYLAISLGDTIPTDPGDLSYYMGTHLTKALANLFWRYNDEMVSKPITDAYNTLNGILDNILHNAVPTFEAEVLHIDKLEPEDDGELYDASGDVVNPY